jgi:hypothetical protein
MDNKTFGIGILSLMMVVLLVANFMPLNTVRANETIKDRDYSLVTGHLQGGGEAVYVLDNRSGLVGVINWDNGKRAITVRAVRPISDCFGQ